LRTSIRHASIPSYRNQRFSNFGSGDAVMRLAVMTRTNAGHIIDRIAAAL
jgi:hypothetical protein